jgi:hypothetical protein
MKLGVTGTRILTYSCIEDVMLYDTVEEILHIFLTSALGGKGIFYSRENNPRHYLVIKHCPALHQIWA